MNAALSFAITLLELMPLVAKGVQGAIDVVESGKALVQTMVEEDRDPTSEEWDTLNDQIRKLREELHTD